MAGTRDDTIGRVLDRPRAQVLVIGGGINGIATFRDLALQGVDVVIVERADWCSGASAASSHMIHGGIRYLENGEFRLVKESVEERNDLLATAPHYVKPLRTTIPIFSAFSGILNAPRRFLAHRSGKPGERGALLIKVGLELYDAFAGGGRRTPRHRFLAGAAAREDMPRVNEGMRYSATYFDASVHDPERLALDLLKDGLDGGRGRARAVARVEAAGVADGGVVLRDVETGREQVFHADVVVNASGPWTDLTNAALGDATRYLGGTKGSHIVLDDPELLAATRGRELFFEHSDGRVVLVYPIKGRVLVGTTDIEVEPGATAVCTDEEVDYFFDLIRHVFPDVRPDRSRIVYRYSGVRPLPAHDDSRPGSVSRDYRIVDTDIPGLDARAFSLVGGKWTTFRALASALGDRVLDALARPRILSTVGLVIGGGRGWPATPLARRRWLAAHDAVGVDRASVLLDRYGTRAAEVIAGLGDDDRMLPASGLSTGEVRYLAEREQALHVTDLVLRRTDLAFTGRVSVEVIEELADALGDVLGWDGDRRRDEVVGTANELNALHGLELAVGSRV